jgi:peptide chain release factor 3
LAFPVFLPEIFRELENSDPLKPSKLEKESHQLRMKVLPNYLCKTPETEKMPGNVGELDA